MTREEFLDAVDSYYELINMDNEYSMGVCDDLVLGEGLDEAIAEDFRYTDYGWVDIRSWLNDIEEGYECYKRVGSFEYEYLTDGDFEDYKSEMLRCMIDNGYIDDDEDETEEEEDEEVYYVLADGEDIESDEPEPPEEDIAVAELFSICNSNFRVLKDEDANKRDVDDTDEADALDPFLW